MKRKVSRANTMALYAAFLVTVGMPLLAMGVDASRVMLVKVKLRSATEAACQAYANSLDIHAFQFENQLRFTKGAANAGNVFHRAMGNSASFVPVEIRKSGSGVSIGGGRSVETIVIMCSSTAFIHAFVPFYGDYAVTSSASAKTKFSTAKQ